MGEQKPFNVLFVMTLTFVLSFTGNLDSDAQHRHPRIINGAALSYRECYTQCNGALEQAQSYQISVYQKNNVSISIVSFTIFISPSPKRPYRNGFYLETHVETVRRQHFYKTTWRNILLWGRWINRRVKSVDRPSGMWDWRYDESSVCCMIVVVWCVLWSSLMARSARWRKRHGIQP